MNKKEIVRSMMAHCGGAAFITKRQYQTYMGISRTTAERQLTGLERVNGKYYFIRDVAAKLLES